MNVCARCDFVVKSEVVTDWQKYYCQCKASEIFLFEVSPGRTACHLFAKIEHPIKPVVMPDDADVQKLKSSATKKEKEKKQMDFIDEDKWITQETQNMRDESL